MKKNRKYWKETAKSVLRGNWGIAIAGMLAYMAEIFWELLFRQNFFREKLSWKLYWDRFLYLLFL